MTVELTPHRFHANCARLLLAILWGTICLLIIAAPLIAANSNSLLSSFIYLFFSPACHQLPARSFAILGYPWGVCQRCAGIYLGLLAAALFSPRFCFEKRISRGSRATAEIGAWHQLRLRFSGSSLHAARVPDRFQNSSTQIRRIWLAAGTIPILADALLSMGGLWQSTPASRLFSGFAFGFLLCTLLVIGITELLREILKPSNSRALVNHGGES